MNDDELLARLQDADPARHDTPADSWLDDLIDDTVEETMSTTPEQSPARKRWVPLAAAAAVALLAAGGAGVALSGGDEDAPAAAPTTTSLTLPGGDTMQSCMMVTPEALAQVDQALAGTATEVTEDSVTLTVDQWFKGGDSDLVTLTPANPDMIALIGAIEFEEGARYLVSAADGHVNSCGFSGPDEEPLAGIYQQAFGG
ncbi:MAG TPA: hypothetical protein VFK41_10900 [Nocardioidaceae bacterium]|nr:hypothetical protein [Nocardioidaceae bacterium]